MRSERHPPSQPEPDEDAFAESRLVVERAEDAWRRQVDSEEAAAPAPRATLWRILLLALAIAAIVFLLFQRLAEIG